MPTITEINKLAKKIRARSPRMKWNNAQKQAAKELRKKVLKSGRKKQTGSSIKKYDLRYSALKPGKRKSASGNIYYESRANRSDKGKLLGVDKNLESQLHSKIVHLLGTEMAMKQTSKTKREKDLHSQNIKLLKQKLKLLNLK